jgi:hypothetical protein
VYCVVADKWRFGIVVKGINTFHHLGIVTRDLALAVAQYERMGFLFTPLSFPEFPLSPGGEPERVGVGNRHAIFENGYLEMLGVIDAARWAAISTSQRGPFDIDRALKRYEGLHVMHFGTEDIDTVRSRLIADGFDPSPVQPFQRQVEDVDGRRMMRAKRVAFPQERNPEGLFQIVQHETPELVLQPRYVRHPNGTRRLSEAILCVRNPEKVSMRYGGYAGRAVERCSDLYVVNLGDARLVIVDPSHLGSILPGETPPTLPYFAGLTVTADMEQAQDYLRRQAIPYVSAGRRLIVSARDGGGTAVVFEKPGAGR